MWKYREDGTKICSGYLLYSRGEGNTTWKGQNKYFWVDGKKIVLAKYRYVRGHDEQLELFVMTADTISQTWTQVDPELENRQILAGRNREGILTVDGVAEGF